MSSQKLVLVLVGVFFAATAAISALAADRNRFDGLWDVTLACPPGLDGAPPYKYEFSAEVKNGALLGRHGTDGSPGSVRLGGVIKGDGTAQLDASGLDAGAYRYPMAARFDEARGAGHRMQGRPCEVIFAKR